MVRNKLHWDANNAVGLPKQRNSYQSSPTFLCFESPTASFASQCNSFRTMWPDPAKGLITLWLLLRCGFIAQLVEYHTGIRRDHGFESRWSPDFFRLLLSSCLNWKIYCDDHSSLWSTTAVPIWIFSYILHAIKEESCLLIALLIYF